MGKEVVHVQVNLDRFIDDLWKLADDDYDYDQCEIMETLVRHGILETEEGCLGVMSAFDGMKVVKRDDFEEDYPKYAKIMTWEEFCANEGFFNNGKYCVMEGE